MGLPPRKFYKKKVLYIQEYLLIMQCLLAGKSYFYAITFELQLEENFGRSLSVWGRGEAIYKCMFIGVCTSEKLP